MSPFAEDGNWLSIGLITFSALLLPYFTILVLLEAICLAIFGTTPARMLFGITVRDREGKKPKFKQALMRTVMLLVMGLGCMIPCITPLTLMMGFHNLTKKQFTPWDKATDLEVHHIEWSTARRIVCFGTVIIYFTLLYLVKIIII